MADIYLKSSNVKVYPTAFRNDVFDRQSRINSEYNITSLVNRLTGRDSFIISGLDKIVNNEIESGELNILGYYFNVMSRISINDLTASPKNNDIIRFKIHIKPTTITSGTEITFNELAGSDTYQGTDEAELNESKYEGLAIDLINSSEYNATQPSINNDTDNTDLDKRGTYGYLPIFKYDGSTWNFIETSKLTYNSSQICVANQNLSGNGLSNTPDTFNKSLEDWLEENFIIDDGEI